MPILLLNRPIAFQIFAIRKALCAQLPENAWRVGEDDSGAPGQSISFDRTQTILGRTKDSMVLISLEQLHAPYEPANGHVPPEHRVHVTISRPSTEDDDLARLIVLTIGAALAAEQDESAGLQLEPGGNWYGAVDMRALLGSVENDPGLSQRDLIGTPEGAAGEADRPAARPADAVAGPAPVETPPSAVAKPRHDLPVPPLARDPEQPPFRRAGGFGRKGL